MRHLFFLLIFCCGTASSEPLMVEVRSMAWKPAYAELGAVSSDWSKGTIQMPFVRSQAAEVAARINEALYLRILGTPAPLSAGRTFELAEGAQPPAGTSWQEVGAVRNDGRLFSVTLEAEGCGAYCET